jgi:hypothetical protein
MMETITYDRDYTYNSISSIKVINSKKDVWGANIKSSKVVKLSELFGCITASTLALELYGLVDNALKMDDYVEMSTCVHGQSDKVIEVYHRGRQYRLYQNRIYTRKAERQIFFNDDLNQFQDTMGNVCQVSFFGSLPGARRAIESLIRCSDCKNCMNISDKSKLNGNSGFPGRS